jgi:hypothetical protein
VFLVVPYHLPYGMAVIAEAGLGSSDWFSPLYTINNKYSIYFFIYFNIFTIPKYVSC